MIVQKHDTIFVMTQLIEKKNKYQVIKKVVQYTTV